MVYTGDLEQINAAYVRHRVESARALIGQPKSAIREQLQFEQEARDRAISEYRALEEWYGGSVTVVFGLIYGDLTAKLTFGDGNKWEFSGSIWGFGAGTGGGVGGGPWADGFVAPGDGEEMGFECISAQYTAGMIQVFWWREVGTIIGSFIGPAGGLGLFGGGGTGKWKKL